MYNYAVGESIHYQTKFTLPLDLGAKLPNGEYKYQYLKLSDLMDKVGTDLDSKSVKILANGEDVTSDFKDAGKYIDSNDGPLIWESDFAGFELNIDLGELSDAQLAKLVALKGKTLTIKYQMKINAEATPYEDIGNQFLFQTRNDPNADWTTLEDESADVETGAYKFVKVSSANEETTLPGAGFNITRGTGDETEYAKFVWLDEDGKETTPPTNPNGSYSPDRIDWVEAPGDDPLVVSGDKGQINIQGLKDGDYQLVEVHAPTGYQIAQEFTPFTVKEAVSDDTEDALVIGSKNVENSPETGYLPITGGTGIVAFLIVGTLAMGSAAYYKKRKA